jgi:hypothetical protein
MSVDSGDVERRFPRRFLMAASAAVAATGVTQALTPAASAAPASTTWKLGGNSGVSTDGTNFIGATNVAPLIFKTKPSSTSSLGERMRLTPGGLLGIGTSAPVCRLDARSGLPIVMQGTSTSTSSAATAVNGVAGNGTGVTGRSKLGSGVSGVSTELYGLQGKGGYAGLRSDGTSYGGIFVASSNGSIGLYSSGNGYGVYGAGNTYGVYGSGSTYGLYGGGGTGVYGSGSTEGITGTTSNVNGNAVHGTGGMYGVHGDNARTAGVRGDSNYVGVWAQAPAFALYAESPATSGQNYAVFAKSNAASCFAVFAQGNVHVNGTLSKAAGSFKIDHPLDPEHKWLSHSFVESPDMMNVYNGNVVLGPDGTATVDLPDYFTELNKDFRYQLTPIGAHAPVFVSSRVKNNTFSIGGGTAGLEVSWQVTGIRQDAYAKAHPIVVETAKSKTDRGSRQFVPAGSKAKLMDAGPSRPAHSTTVPAAPTMPTPKIR